MSTTELFETTPSREIAIAELVAAELKDNLNDYIAGGRESFEAHFPVSIGSDVQDEAHERFLDSIGVKSVGEGFITISGGVRIYVSELRYSEAEGGKPYHVAYSTEPPSLNQG